MGATTTQVRVGLPAEAVIALRKLATARNMTMTSALVSAIRTEGFIARLQDEGAKVLVQAPDGSLREMIFV